MGWEALDPITRCLFIGGFVSVWAGPLRWWGAVGVAAVLLAVLVQITLA